MFWTSCRKVKKYYYFVSVFSFIYFLLVQFLTDNCHTAPAIATYGKIVSETVPIELIPSSIINCSFIYEIISEIIITSMIVTIEPTTAKSLYLLLSIIFVKININSKITITYILKCKMLVRIDIVTNSILPLQA